MGRKACTCCGMPVYDRYKSGLYDIVCCSIECLKEQEDRIEFELEFGRNENESTEYQTALGMVDHTWL